MSGYMKHQRFSYQQQCMYPREQEPTSGGRFYRSEAQTRCQRNFSERSGFVANDQRFDVRADVIAAEQIPPKPTAYREKIIDKVTDVCNVLTTLSELKCDARLSSGGPSDANQRAVRYACDSKHNPDAKRPILHDWQQLFNGLMQEFTPVCVVLRQLAARCLMAPPNADVDKLTVVVCEFVASHSMRVLRICGDIGFEMEHEVIALMGLLDRLYYCVRRASTDIWLMRMLLTCRQQNA